MRVEQANLFKNAAYKLKSSKKFKSKYHDEKFLHIHDNEYNGITYNCLGVRYISKEYSNADVNENLELNLSKLFEEIVYLTNEQSGGIGYINIDTDLANVFQNITIEKGTQSIRRFFEKLNLPLRNGYERAYITFNLGLDTSIGGRKVTQCFLQALNLGKIETNEPFIFPNIVFKVKKGVNYFFKDKNFDLFTLATEVSSIRMNPTYFNCDSINVNKIESNRLGIMGCRTLMLNNIHGENGALYRGNVASVSINLPKIALMSKNKEDFFKNLKKIAIQGKNILIKKYKKLSFLEKNNFYYLVSNNLYLGCNSKENNMENIFRNGSLSLGFIGLYDAISYLKKEEITKQLIVSNIDFAKEILEFMKKLVDTWTIKYNLNFSLLGSSGEGISGRFAEDDINKDFYTNSFHVPVYIEIDAIEKLDIESNFVKYCNGGEISYIEFSAPILTNKEAIMDIIKYAFIKEHIYLGINFPLDYCLDCHSTNIFIGKTCEKCGSENLKKVRRVSGYLSIKENLSSGKKFEEEKRVAHIFQK